MSVVPATFKPRVDEKHPWAGRLSSVAFDTAIKRVAATRAREDVDFIVYIWPGKIVAVASRSKKGTL